jgi:hypothetical protein
MGYMRVNRLPCKRFDREISSNLLNIRLQSGTIQLSVVVAGETLLGAFEKKSGEAQVENNYKKTGRLRTRKLQQGEVDVNSQR